MIEKKDFTPALQHYLSLGPHLAFVFLDAHYQKATLEVELQDLKKRWSSDQSVQSNWWFENQKVQWSKDSRVCTFY